MFARFRRYSVFSNLFAPPQPPLTYLISSGSLLGELCALEGFVLKKGVLHPDWVSYSLSLRDFQKINYPKIPLVVSS
jgi:hypothetical protein